MSIVKFCDYTGSVGITQFLQDYQAMIARYDFVEVVTDGPYYEVTVFEKDDRIGGLLMYGIPHFKMEKTIVYRRVALMEEEGIIFRTGVHIGVDVSVKNLQTEFDSVVLCGGAQKPRDLPVEGRDLNGIHFAMDFLPQQNKRNEGDTVPDDISITAEGKNVLIIGGGDTGSDCLGTSLRQGGCEHHRGVRGCRELEFGARLG